MYNSPITQAYNLPGPIASSLQEEYNAEMRIKSENVVISPLECIHMDEESWERLLLIHSLTRSHARSLALIACLTLFIASTMKTVCSISDLSLLY